MRLIKQFEKLIAQNQWWKAKQPVVVAVSTGVDSMVLLDLLKNLSTNRPEIIVAHFNHQLRTQSQTEERFIRKYCHDQQLQLQVDHWDPQNLTTGLEEKARQARYRFFAQVMKKSGAQVLLTAHHQNDQAETVLMKLTRSGNLHEVEGIATVRSFAGCQLIRPLLSFSKDELSRYADLKNLQWYEDETNRQNDVFRNRIRNEILPTLKDDNRQVVKHLADFAQQLREQERLLDKLVTEKIKAAPSLLVKNDQVQICPKQLDLDLGLILNWMIRQLQPGQVISTKQLQAVEKLLKNARKPQGKIDLGNQIEIKKEYELLKVKKIQNEIKNGPGIPPFMVVLNHWYTSELGNQFGVFQRSEIPNESVNRKSSFWLTKQQLPLSVRSSNATDRLVLKNGNGKKARRILIDKKISNERRNLVQTLVTNEEQPLALIGIQESFSPRQVGVEEYILLTKRGV